MTESGNDIASEPYVCETCGKEFESEEALETHLRDAGLVD